MPICPDVKVLSKKMKGQRVTDFMEYFNGHKGLQSTRSSHVQPNIQEQNIAQPLPQKAAPGPQMYQGNLNMPFESGLSKPSQTDNLVLAQYTNQSKLNSGLPFVQVSTGKNQQCQHMQQADTKQLMSTGL